jgi:hypothetical protein
MIDICNDAEAAAALMVCEIVLREFNIWLDDLGEKMPSIAQTHPNMEPPAVGNMLHTCAIASSSSSDGNSITQS